MESILLVQLIVLGLAIAFAAFLFARNDESVSRKYAKIRVRADESRGHHLAEPQEEEDLDLSAALAWLVSGALLLILLLAFFAR